MITEKQIDNLSTKLQTSFENIAREYIQTRFLSYFYQHEQSSSFYFKGGTALRLIHESPRFSEDLDFSSTIYNCAQFEDVLFDVLVRLEYEGIKIDIQESKKTRWGCLAVYYADVHKRQLEVKTDISLRQKKLQGETLLLKSPVSPSFSVMGLVQKQLVKEKLRALLKRGKSRDYFDLYYILRARMNALEVVPYKQKILASLKKIKSNYFNELSEFLPKSYNMLLKDFKNSLTSELERL